MAFCAELVGILNEKTATRVATGSKTNLFRFNIGRFERLSDHELRLHVPHTGMAQR
jgi:hypothetical protein